MKKHNKEKGTALVSVLFLSVIVAGLSTSYLVRSIQTSRCTRNDLAGERALHLAEAGLDLAIAELGSIDDGIDNDGDMLVDEEDEWDGIVSGQLGGGDFSVQTWPTQSGLYCLVSTAVVDGITRTVEANVFVLSKGSPLVPPAALTIVNDENEFGLSINFSGNAFVITGHDTNIDGNPGPAESVYGIAVYDDDSVQDILSSLNANEVQNDNIAGAGGAPSVINATDISDLDLETVFCFAEEMRLVADMQLQTLNISPYDATKLTNATFGTPDAPLVTYVGSSLEVCGSSGGAGILVVDGDFNVKGNFEFNGLVVVTGTSSLDFYNTNRGNVRIHGALIVGNPDVFSQSETYDIDMRGNVEVWYSSIALACSEQALGDCRSPVVISWQRTR